MRVWVLTELYYPEDTSTGYFLTKTAEALSECYPVYVLSSQPTYAARGIRAPARELHNGVHIQRCVGTALNKDILLFRLINLVTITLSIMFTALIRVQRGDCVMVATNPPVLPFGIALVCRLRGCKCVLLVQDVYPEALLASRLASSRSLLVRTLSWMTCRLYASMERIVVLGRDMEALVKRRLDGNASKAVLIHNWADVDEISPRARQENSLLQKLGLADKFVLQYSGNIGRMHGIECLVDTARQMAAHPDVHFLFIGAGAKRQWLEDTVEREGIPNVTILPLRPRSEIETSLNACDVALISLLPGAAGVSVPSRMYNVMAAGKPIIAVAEQESELSLVVQEESIGWVVPPEQPAELRKAILEAKSDRGRLAEMGSRARFVAEQKYTLERISRLYQQMVRDLASPLEAHSQASPG